MDKKLDEINNKLSKTAEIEKMEALQKFCDRNAKLITNHQGMVNALKQYIDICKWTDQESAEIARMMIQIVITGRILLVDVTDIAKIWPDQEMFKEIFELWQISEMRKVELKDLYDEIQNDERGWH